MSKDRFTIPLECPSCGKSGNASCWQEDGWAYLKGNKSTTVDVSPKGFTRVNKPSNWGHDINFTCDKCNKISVINSR